MRSSSQRRVLQVIESTLGGTRRYLEDVFDALGDGPQNGLAYSLNRADTGFTKLLGRVRSAGWQLFEVDMRRSISAHHDASSVRAMREVYRAFQPHIVHAHSSKAGAVSRLASVAIRPRPAVVYTPNAIGVNLGWIYRPIEQLLALRLDVLAAVTASERRELQELKLVSPLRLCVVPPTIRSDVFAPMDRRGARQKLGLPGAPLIVGIGRLTPQKDPLAFVDLVAILRQRIRDVRAIWVGDGESRSEMETAIADLGLGDALTITGWLADVRPYLGACDLFVSSSAYESFGYVTAEALAMERPVVASAINGTVDIVSTDVAEQLYPQGKMSLAATLAERLLRDPDRAAAIARRGRAHVLSTFSVEATRRGLDHAYSLAVS